MLISGSHDKYYQTRERTDEEDPIENDYWALDDPMVEGGEFGSVSILDLETFGSELPVVHTPEDEMEEMSEEETVDEVDDGEEEKEKESLQEKAIEEETLVVKDEPDRTGGEITESVCVKDAPMNSSHGSLSEHSESSDMSIAEKSAAVEERMCQNEPHLTERSDVKRSEVKESDSGAKSKARWNLVKLEVNSGSVDREEMHNQQSESEGKQENRDTVLKLNEKKTNESMDAVKVNLGTEAALRTASQKGKIYRMRFSSGSDSDGENKLMIVTDSDKEECVKEPKTPDDSKSKEKMEHGVQKSPVECENPKEESNVAAEGSGKAVELAQIKTEVSGKDVQELECSPQSPEKKEVKTKGTPATRMVTRRSARIRKLSSCEEKTDSEQPEVVPKKRKTRKRKGKQSGSHEETSGPQKKEGGSKYSKESTSNQTQVSSEPDINVTPTKKPVVDTNAQSSVKNRTRRSKVKVEAKDTSPLSENMSRQETKIDAENIVRDIQGHDHEQELKKGDIKGSPSGKEVPSEPKKRPSTRRQVKTKVSPDKTGTPGKQEKTPSASARKVGRTESTIDEIMRLQEKMLTTDSHQGQGQSQGHPPGLGPESQTMTDGLQHQGIYLQEPSEGNCAYSLWKFGKITAPDSEQEPGTVEGGARHAEPGERGGQDGVPVSAGLCHSDAQRPYQVVAQHVSATWVKGYERSVKKICITLYLCAFHSL